MAIRKETMNILKFTFSSFSSYVGELIIFVLMMIWLKPIIGKKSIIVSTVIARICSSIYCYFFNSRLVFQSTQSSTTGFYILMVLQMSISALAVYGLSLILCIKVTYIKMIVDTILFIISYFIQKTYIFH